jgi:AcrR family transcriptional regulator
MYVTMMARRTAQQAAGTRQDLVEAALAVFGECGYQTATLEQIAGRANLTRGALDHHFAGKADLYDAVLREQADQMMRPLLARLAGGGLPPISVALAGDRAWFVTAADSGKAKRLARNPR